MASLSIIGTGNMGSAIAQVAGRGGTPVQLIGRDAQKAAAAAEQAGDSATHATLGDELTGDIVVLALPYAAVAEVLEAYRGRLGGKVIVDLTNPVDFSTFDSLVVPADSSAAAGIAEQVPEASVVKAFNINFAATLASGSVGEQQTTVVIAGDDADAKSALATVVEAGGLRAVDAGSLKRARELEALGFLQISLAAGEKTSWTTGFALLS